MPRFAGRIAERHLDVDADALEPTWERERVLAASVDEESIARFWGLLVPFLTRAVERELGLIVVIFPHLWDWLPLS